VKPAPRRLLITTAQLDDAAASAEALVVTSEHIAMIARRRRPATAIQVITTEPEGRADFVEAAAFERRKYEAFVPILAERLNRIHGITRDDAYWDRIIGTTLLMHVSACRRVFAAYALARREALEFQTLAESAFGTPADEGAHRELHQYSELGDEQLFAILAGSESRGRFTPTEKPATASVAAPPAPVAQTLRRARSLARRVLADPSWLAREVAARVVTRRRRPEVLVTRCFWSYRARQAMILRGRGRVVVDDTGITFHPTPANSRAASRITLSAAPASGDAFDRFFFETLRWSAPASWLEDFPARLAATRALLDTRPTIRAIVNETVDEPTCLLLAEAKQRGIELLHCEHNYLQHQFVGNMVWFHLRKFDRYLTLGWSDEQTARIIPAGSYFSWTEPPRPRKDVDLLFVSSVCLVRPPLLSAGYGEAGSANAASYADMTRQFLGALSDRTLARMYYRDYPVDRRMALFEHPVEATLLDGFRDRIGTVERTGAVNTTTLMSRARLTVVNYLSTAYNQALLAGGPTIVLFNDAAYHLTDEARGFYDDLLRAGIFHTDPVQAAALIESILDAPDTWWQRSEVQSARSSYLRANFGSPDALGRYILGAARNPEA
jgi:putative transferase (TIGR04331 family)